MSAPLPRVLCAGWTTSTGVKVRCVMPVIHTGEPGGKVETGWRCSLCGAHQIRANEMKWRREGEALLRQRARGYGGPVEGEDVFRNFR